MNKGITFKKDTKVAEVIQAWCFLTRFILDLTENKSEEYSIEDNSEGNREEYKEYFIKLLKEFTMFSEFGRPDNVKEVTEN